MERSFDSACAQPRGDGPGHQVGNPVLPDKAIQFRYAMIHIADHPILRDALFILVRRSGLYG